MVCENCDVVRERDLMDLWGRARTRALRQCAGTLSRLAGGDGGFGGADDLMQDLFLEFWRLVRLHDGGPIDDLWEAWESVLWRGGIRVLRRRPQRLWRRRERPIALSALAVNECSSRMGGLSRRARSRLTIRETPERVAYRTEAFATLEADIFRLRPLQRQALYLLAIRGLSGAEVARRLHLGNANAVYQRVSRARAALRRRARQRKARF